MNINNKAEITKWFIFLNTLFEMIQHKYYTIVKFYNEVIKINVGKPEFQIRPKKFFAFNE